MQYKIRCTLDEPLQRLMQKLSTKSSDLYIFWQNYNQLYQLYNEQYLELQVSRDELERLRKQPPQRNYGPTQSQYNQLKDKVWILQKQVSDYRNENQHLKQQLDVEIANNDKLNQENTTHLSIIKQFRDQNLLQRQNIDNMLAKLRDTQQGLQVTSQNKVFIQELQEQLRKYKLNQEQMRRLLQEKDHEIHTLTISLQEYKLYSEKVIIEAMRNAKNKIVEGLPTLIQQSMTLRTVKYAQ